MKEMMHKIKWFWAWQDGHEEAWLRKMSQKGWHLVSVKPFGIYNFKAGEKMDFVYRLDYQAKRKDRIYYLQLFQDAGWEHISEMSGWQYFCKQVEPGESPEIYTDVESKVAKYKRLIAYLGFIDFFMIWITGGRILRYDNYPWNAIQIIFVGVVLLLTYNTIRLALRIRQLRRLM